MRNFLVVTTPASNLTLLTAAEMRTAAGVTGTGEDAVLTALEAQAAASIMSECNIAVGEGAEPTLKQETLTETFYCVKADRLLLARRHNVAITSVTVDDEALASSEWQEVAESAFLYRLCDDTPIRWCAEKIIVVYQAGFSTIPADLKQAASDYLRLLYLEKDRDPAVKGQEIDVPGVMRERTDYWAGALPGQTGEGAVPAVVAGQLKRFRNHMVY